MEEVKVAPMKRMVQREPSLFIGATLKRDAKSTCS